MHRYFFVAADAQLPNGTTLHDVPLSRRMHRAGVCRRVLKRARRTQPGAFMVQVTRRC